MIILWWWYWWWYGVVVNNDNDGACCDYDNGDVDFNDDDVNNLSALAFNFYYYYLPSLI